LLLAAACAWSAPAAAAPPDTAPAWGLPELMQALAGVKESKAVFSERKYLHVLRAPADFSGTLSYTAPDHLEKITLRPSRERMVLDGDTVVMENEARSQRRTLKLSAYPAIGAMVEGMRSTLAGDLATLSRFYTVQLNGDEAAWRLVLSPVDSQARAMISEIRIKGSSSRIVSIESIEPDGDRSVMDITEERP